MRAPVPRATQRSWRLKKYHELPWFLRAWTLLALSTMTSPRTVRKPTTISSITYVAGRGGSFFRAAAAAVRFGSAGFRAGRFAVVPPLRPAALPFGAAVDAPAAPLPFRAAVDAAGAAALPLRAAVDAAGAAALPLRAAVDAAGAAALPLSLPFRPARPSAATPLPPAARLPPPAGPAADGERRPEALASALARRAASRRA